MPWAAYERFQRAPLFSDFSTGLDELQQRGSVSTRHRELRLDAAGFPILARCLRGNVGGADISIDARLVLLAGMRVMDDEIDEMRATEAATV
jgi:hypothetical protein